MRIKKGTEGTLNFSSKMISDLNDETYSPHNLLLTDTQVLKLCEAFANNSSANIKLLKTWLSKMAHDFWL